MKKIKPIKNRLYILFFPVLVLGVLLLTPCPKSQETKIDAPSYIYTKTLWPPPHSKISMSCLARRCVLAPITSYMPSLAPYTPISISILTLPILDLEKTSQNDEKVYKPFYERVSLYVDDKILAITSVSEAGGVWYTDENGNSFSPDLAGSYAFGANVFLWTGDHVAKVEIATLSGQILKFEWNFTIAWF
jgi:hypothetical protein